MAKYYNTTRGPIAVALSSGASMTLMPKSWTDIAPSDEGSPNLAPMIRKGFLKRSALADLAEPVVAVVEPLTTVAAPAPSTVVTDMEDLPAVKTDWVKNEPKKK